jgi:DNA polymerase-3 subunit alpha
MFLNCHTYYSLRYGTLSPKQLITAAQVNGRKALVLTDINNTSCSYEFITKCTQVGIKPILGIEFRKKHQLLYIGIAKNNEGFRALNQFLSEYIPMKSINCILQI